MTCDDFATTWNEYLDLRCHAAPELMLELQAHAAGCSKCRTLQLGFQALTHAPATPGVPDDLAERILSAWRLETRRPRWISRPAVWALSGGLAAAAALVLTFTLMKPVSRSAPEIAVKPVIPKRPWTSALADATSATLALARETSAPAARVGQEVLNVGRPSDISWPVTWESSSSSAELMESVSKSVNSQFKPLSGSARKAFSFLVAPSNPNPPRNSPDAGA